MPPNQALHLTRPHDIQVTCTAGNRYGTAPCNHAD